MVSTSNFWLMQSWEKEMPRVVWCSAAVRAHVELKVTKNWRKSQCFCTFKCRTSAGVARRTIWKSKFEDWGGLRLFWRSNCICLVSGWGCQSVTQSLSRSVRHSVSHCQSASQSVAQSVTPVRQSLRSGSQSVFASQSVNVPNSEFVSKLY